MLNREKMEFLQIKRFANNLCILKHANLITNLQKSHKLLWLNEDCVFKMFCTYCRKEKMWFIKAQSDSQFRCSMLAHRWLLFFWQWGDDETQEKCKRTCVTHSKTNSKADTSESCKPPRFLADHVQNIHLWNWYSLCGILVNQAQSVGPHRVEQHWGFDVLISLICLSIFQNQQKTLFTK